MDDLTIEALTIMVGAADERVKTHPEEAPTRNRLTAILCAAIIEKHLGYNPLVEFGKPPK